MESVEFVDLASLKIGYFSYTNENTSDDFLPLLERLLRTQLWILATPLYWYTMSAHAKTFLDRLTDTLQFYKDFDVQIRGKRLVVLCTGADASVPLSFDDPFWLTCEYLGMEFLSNYNLQFEERNPKFAVATMTPEEFGRQSLEREVQLTR